MLLFFLGVAVLVLGFFTYGALVEKVFAPTDNPTPAQTMADGVDYVKLPLWRIVIIQFLNIAGLGPIYGAIAGALFGPAAFLWIAFGCIFAGAVHDYTVGMTSIRNKGATVGELVGTYLGPVPRSVMRVLSLILLLLVGVVFTKGPAAVLFDLLQRNIPNMPAWLNPTVLFYVILGYYFIGTFLPINKLIAPIYPYLGGLLICTALALLVMVLVKGYSIPFEGFKNVHPQGDPIYPFLFLTIACGAISGFHATVSPMMARCVASERQVRTAFYGAMIIEGILAMIWACVPMAFFHNESLKQAIGVSASDVAKLMFDNGALNNPGGVVNAISLSLLGGLGGVLAVLGVVICPVTSGDACFRSIRLQMADVLKLPQHSARNRLLILIPLMAVGILLNYIDFNILWRYFAFTNQLLASFALWMGTGYLAQDKKAAWHWITTLPAAFMTSVCTTYIMTAKIGFNLPYEIAKNIGIATGLISIILAQWLVMRTKRKLQTA